MRGGSAEAAAEAEAALAGEEGAGLAAPEESAGEEVMAGPDDVAPALAPEPSLRLPLSSGEAAIEAEAERCGGHLRQSDTLASPQPILLRLLRHQLEEELQTFAVAGVGVELE